MKKVILSLLMMFSSMMFVGCENKDLKFEKDIEFEITKDICIVFIDAKEYHYSLHNEIMLNSPMCGYKAIQVEAMIKNNSDKDIDNILDLIDFSCVIDETNAGVTIQDTENKYDVLLSDENIEVRKGTGNVIFLTFTYPGYIEWERITLTENNTQKNWSMMPIHVSSDYYVQPNDDVTFFERMTTLNSFEGELSRFYGIQIEVEEGYTIYGVTEDEEVISLYQIHETNDEIISESYVATTNTNWYGNALYPIKGYIITDGNGDDCYINRTNYPKEVNTTYRRYFSGNEQGLITFEMDGKTYETQIPFSAVVHYKDGVIEKVDSFVYHYDLTWNIPSVGHKGQTGSYELIENGTNAKVKLSLRYLSETGESSLIVLEEEVK